jgi:hypothetical protein
MTIDLMLDELIEILCGITPSLDSASSACDVFEAYIFSIILESAKTEGARINFRDINGNRALTNFVFRTSPGKISSRRQPYSYATINFEGKPQLEAHLGVYITGKSDVYHECDVAVLYSTEAEYCRRNQNIIPRHTKVLIAAECKYYAGSITLNLGRSFLGLCTDIGYQYGDRFFISNTSSSTVEKLLERHKAQWEHKIVPQNVVEVNRLKGVIQNVFKRYKAREN